KRDANRRRARQRRHSDRGTDFDSRINTEWVMPTLGYRTVGTKGRIVPSALYFDLSTWHRINLLYLPKFMGTLRELRTFFTDPRPHRQLIQVIEQRLGCSWDEPKPRRSSCRSRPTRCS